MEKINPKHLRYCSFNKGDDYYHTEGPWSKEPDLIIFTVEGLPAVMTRQHAFGVWIGYVLYLKHGGKLDEDLIGYDVHGGVTWHDYFPNSEMVTDLLAPHFDGNHYFAVGFDTCHAWDFKPAGVKFDFEDLTPGMYKDVPFVINELTHLAHSVKELLDTPDMAMLL